tara:strand:- start:2151 stop:2960 length:810 start_codon:yes stop_codon:yes gene_type:complete
MSYNSYNIIIHNQFSSDEQQINFFSKYSNEQFRPYYIANNTQDAELYNQWDLSGNILEYDNSGNIINTSNVITVNPNIVQQTFFTQNTQEIYRPFYIAQKYNNVELYESQIIDPGKIRVVQTDQQITIYTPSEQDFYGNYLNGGFHTMIEFEFEESLENILPTSNDDYDYDNPNLNNQFIQPIGPQSNAIFVYIGFSPYYKFGISSFDENGSPDGAGIVFLEANQIYTIFNQDAFDNNTTLPKLINVQFPGQTQDYTIDTPEFVTIDYK